MTVTLSAADVHGNDIDFEVDRVATPAAYSQSYTMGTAAIVGTHPCSVKFYSQAAAGGIVVASAQSNVTIASDGSGIGTISVTGVVASVAVSAGQTVTARGTQLAFSAKDSRGDILALTPGSASWTLIDGASYISLTQDGLASPVASGTAHVDATVDGVASPAVAVTVLVAPDFLNPSFEMPVIPAGTVGNYVQGNPTSWTAAPPSGYATGNSSWGTGAHSGAQYAYVPASNNNGQNISSMAQTLTGLTVGKAYTVTFWMAQRKGGAGGAPIRAFVDAVQEFGPTTPATDGSWNSYRFSFTAWNTSHTFTFKPDVPTTPNDSADLLDDFHLALGP